MHNYPKIKQDFEKKKKIFGDDRFWPSTCDPKKIGPDHKGKKKNKTKPILDS